MLSGSKAALILSRVAFTQTDESRRRCVGINLIQGQIAVGLIGLGLCFV